MGKRNFDSANSELLKYIERQSQGWKKMIFLMKKLFLFGTSLSVNNEQSLRNSINCMMKKSFFQVVCYFLKHYEHLL